MSSDHPVKMSDRGKAFVNECSGEAEGQVVVVVGIVCERREPPGKKPSPESNYSQNKCTESHELRAYRHSERHNMTEFNHLEEDATRFHRKCE